VNDDPTNGVFAINELKAASSTITNFPLDTVFSSTDATAVPDGVCGIDLVRLCEDDACTSVWSEAGLSVYDEAGVIGLRLDSSLPTTVNTELSGFIEVNAVNVIEYYAFTLTIADCSNNIISPLAADRTWNIQKDRGVVSLISALEITDYFSIVNENVLCAITEYVLTDESNTLVTNSGDTTLYDRLNVAAYLNDGAVSVDTDLG